MACLKQGKEANIKIFIDIYDMFSIIARVMDYGQQTIWIVIYIGQSFMITLLHANYLFVT